MKMNEGLLVSQKKSLPVEWNILSFSESIDKKRTNIPESINASDYKKFGKYPIIDQSKKFICGYTDEDKYILRSDLPIILFGDHTRIFKYLDMPFALGADGTKLIFPKIDKFYPKFLYYYFCSLKIQSRGYNRHFKSLKEFAIIQPPLSEQKCIAHILSTVQEARDRTQQVIEAVRELKKSLMKHLFTYGPVPLTEVVKVQLKETDVGKLPVHWSLVHLRDLTLRAFGGGTPSTKKPEYWDGPIPWTTTAIIKEEDIYLTKYQRGITEMGLEHSSTKIAQKGTLLVGTRVGVGKAVVATFDIAINQDLTAIKLNTDLANPEFISNLFKTQLIQQWFVSNKRGATIKGVPREDLMTLKIPLPPFHEQQTIVHILQTLDRKLQAEQIREQALETLFRTLLDNLMTGKIRVNHIEVP